MGSPLVRRRPADRGRRRPALDRVRPGLPGPGPEIRPVHPRPGGSAWSRGPGGRPGLGRLPGRPDHRRDPDPPGRPEPGRGGRSSGSTTSASGPRRGGRPTRSPATRPPRPDGPGPRRPLLDFRIVGNRVFCLRGDQALLAFDGDSGQLDWSYAPAAGRINPQLLVGPRRVVLQVRKPNAILVLDTASGRRRAEFPQGEDDEWPRDPLPIDDDHVALVADRITVALLDTGPGA